MDVCLLVLSLLMVFSVYSTYAITTPHTILRLRSNTSLGLFELWNMTNVSCGTDSMETNYRHDYIDQMNVSCIESLTLEMNSPSPVFYKYTSLQSPILENILGRQFNWVNPLRDTFSTDKYFVNYHNYEFLSLTASSDTIHIGIYNNQSSNDGIQFVYSLDGVPFNVNVDPKQINGINISDAININISVYNYCEFESQSPHYTICPEKPVVSSRETYITANIGSTQTLDCSYQSHEAGIVIKWFHRNNQDESVEISMIESKYSGATPESPSLIIYSVTSSDEGLYYCQIQNVAGIATGPYITLNVKQNPESGNTDTCPCLCSYSERLEYWSKQNVTNHTTEEWREILAPIIEELQAEIKVDTSKLSSTVYKYKSAPDSRTSSKSMGVLGILLLSLIFGSIVISDILGFFRQSKLIKRYANKFRIFNSS